jgi:hypothetical protein
MCRWFMRSIPLNNAVVSINQQHYDQDIGFPNMTPLTPRGMKELIMHMFMFCRCV